MNVLQGTMTVLNGKRVFLGSCAIAARVQFSGSLPFFQSSRISKTVIIRMSAIQAELEVEVILYITAKSHAWRHRGI